MAVPGKYCNDVRTLHGKDCTAVPGKACMAVPGKHCNNVRTVLGKDCTVLLYLVRIVLLYLVGIALLYW